MMAVDVHCIWCNTSKMHHSGEPHENRAFKKVRLQDLEAVLWTYFLFSVNYLIFTTKCHQSMAFYRTKHDPEMDYFPSEACLSHQPPSENLTILEGKNHNQDVYKVAQGEIEMVNLPW